MVFMNKPKHFKNRLKIKKLRNLLLNFKNYTIKNKLSQN